MWTLTQLQRPRDHCGPAVWRGVKSRGFCSICVRHYVSWRASRTLTSPQGSDALLQPVSLAGLVLARVLVDYCQVLVPVAPVHLVYPEEDAQSQMRRASRSCVCVRLCSHVFGVQYLKHQRRSGVPSQFFPTVTISPARKDLRRQTGKERSMSKMVVAHCSNTVSNRTV